MDSKDIRPREVFGVLIKWRRVILFNVGILVFISVVVSLVLPKSYTATATIMPPVEEAVSLGLSAMLGAK